MMIPM